VAVGQSSDGTGEQAQRHRRRNPKSLTPERHFLFTVALALGKTVREIEEGMPATEIAEWAVYYKDRPFGDFRGDLRMGILAALIARTMGGSKTAKPSDFMPFIDKTPVEPRGRAPSARAREAAQVTQAFMTASSKLSHRTVRRVTKGKPNGHAR
jgi:hypothetical protein